MRWNADFEIASAVFQLVLLVFFILKKHMPTRQNRVYMMLAAVSTLTVILDVISAVMSSYPESFGRTMIIVVNTLYLALVPVLSFSFLVYVIILTGRSSFLKSPYFAVFAVPAILSLLMAFSSPVTGLLFYVDENLVYHQGSGYMLQMAANTVYLLVTLAFIIAFGKNMRRLERNVIYCFCIFMTVGAILQGFFFRWVLLTNAMTALSIALMYMALQNPDSYIDKSTGLYNQDAFRVLASEYLEDGKRFSCIYIHINRETLSRTQADFENYEAAVLDVAGYLKHIFVGNDIFRVNQDSFVIIEWDKGDYEKIADAIMQRGKTAFEGKNEKVILTLNCTILPYWMVPGEVGGIVSYLTYAQNEKHDERGVLEIDENIVAKMEKGEVLKNALERAVAENTVQIYLQPIFSKRADRYVGFEALARIFDEATGFIEPSYFIRFFEENGTMPKFGRQVFEKVCAFISTVDLKSYGVKSVRVNLSIKQLQMEKLTDMLIDITDAYNVSRGNIELEIEESVSGAKDEVVHRNLQLLNAAGFMLTLDGYGAGNSSLSRIVDMPFNAIKIDKSLLEVSYHNKVTLLPDIVKILTDYGMNIMACGVEDAGMRDMIDGMAIDLQQGYFYSRPLPTTEFAKMLERK